MDEASIAECASHCQQGGSAGVNVIEVEALLASPAFKAAIQKRALEIKHGLENLLRLGVLSKWQLSIAPAANLCLENRPRQWEGKQLVECINEVYGLIDSAFRVFDFDGCGYIHIKHDAQKIIQVLDRSGVKRLWGTLQQQTNQRNMDVHEFVGVFLLWAGIDPQADESVGDEGPPLLLPNLVPIEC